MEKTSITPQNLKQFEGETIILNISVGIMGQFTGKLRHSYGFCWYALVLPDGSKIGFSWGKWNRNEDGKLIISIQ